MIFELYSSVSCHLSNMLKQISLVHHRVMEYRNQVIITIIYLYTHLFLITVHRQVVGKVIFLVTRVNNYVKRAVFSHSGCIFLVQFGGRGSVCLRGGVLLRSCVLQGGVCSGGVCCTGVSSRLGFCLRGRSQPTSILLQPVRIILECIVV